MLINKENLMMKLLLLSRTSKSVSSIYAILIIYIDDLFICKGFINVCTAKCTEKITT